MRSRSLRTLAFGCLLTAAAGTQPAAPNSKMPAVAGTPVELANMRYIDIATGAGALAAPGKQYTVHYTGWLRDGTSFDSSLDRNQPLKFTQGRKQVITGWEIGFEGMKAGGKRRLFIPYQLAYGEKGSGPIPPNSELIFDVELLDVSDVPQLATAVDVLLTFKALETKVMALAKAVPEEKYSWRPAPGAPSFAEIFLDIPRGNQLLQHKELVPAPEAAGKQRVMELLGENFAAIRKTLESARPSLSNREADLAGQPTTMRGIYTAIDAHRRNNSDRPSRTPE
jgi:FKBP-type peptidyl-prolyl cis-trans isomerase